MRELAMTKEQYELVMKEIENNHSWCNHGFSNDKCKYIKYVRPNWDMRDGMCFSIHFEGLSCGMDGMKFGSGYGETIPLYDQVMEWLNKPLPPVIKTMEEAKKYSQNSVKIAKNT